MTNQELEKELAAVKAELDQARLKISGFEFVILQLAENYKRREQVIPPGKYFESGGVSSDVVPMQGTNGMGEYILPTCLQGKSSNVVAIPEAYFENADGTSTKIVLSFIDELSKAIENPNIKKVKTTTNENH